MKYSRNIIEEKKGIVTIGMISSGKSTFLNSIFGFKFLQTNDNITTKFICVIRYNPNLKESKFYKLKLINKREKIDEYTYLKEGIEYIGKTIIKNKIKSINDENHNSIEPKYENLFWMLEVNTIPLENTKLMEKYDFYDIPGLNEYISSKENDKLNKQNDKIIQEKSINNKANPPAIRNISNQNMNKMPKEANFNENFRYIKGIFKYLKGKIENFIFIISTESCYKPTNLGIIEEIRKNIDFDYQGGLFVLTKIDLSENKENKIDDCKQYFINNMPSNIFNLHFNTFIPLNSITFEIEMKMKNKIKYYYLYFYHKYYDEYINISDKDKNNKNKEFIEYIEEIIKNEIGNNNYMNFIEDATNDYGIDVIDPIKKEYEKINVLKREILTLELILMMKIVNL